MPRFFPAQAALTACAISLGLVSALFAAELTPAGKGAAPKLGVQKPGVQIAFSRLKADQEFALAPAWMLNTDMLLMPDAKGEALARIDLRASKMGDPLSGVGQPCAGAVQAFNSLWVMDCAAGQIVRLNTRAKKGEEMVQAKLQVGVGKVPAGIAATSDSIYAITDNKVTLSRIDPVTNKVVAEMRLPAACGEMRFGEDSLWVSCPSTEADQNKLLRIHPATMLVQKSIKVSPQTTSFVLGGGSVWVLGAKESKVERIDPKTDKITETIALEVPGATGRLAFGENALWVTLTGFPLTRIDPETNTVAQQFKGEGGGAILTTPGFVWLSNLDKGTLWKIDTRRILATLAE